MSFVPWIVALVLVVLVAILHRLVLRLFGVVLIPDDAIGIVNKKWVLLGSNRTLPDGSIVALNGEAGLQADTLAPGVHFFLWPWQYAIELEDFTTIAPAETGVVEARDGVALPAGRVIGKGVVCDSFQSARKFLTGGGERGPQGTLIPPGTYRINTSLFTVRAVAQLEIADNMVGIVTTKEGATLATGDIAGAEVPGHNSFQNADAFVAAGGFKGLQEQVILAGRYFLNPLFATVEILPMTEVPIAHVGVVIAYVGAMGKDLSGAEFQHGNLFSRGEKGVWADPLDPGKYPINTYTHRVVMVPTANVVLNWATGKNEAHKLDEKLSTITVRSSDGFRFNLDVSQIIHVPRNSAPMVIARFGSMAALVTQVLEPTIGNYFRNAAQSSDVITFLTSRTERQKEARDAISAALKEYSVGAVDTLIGDIVPPEELMKTLTDRKLAQQQQITYGTQQQAEAARMELEKSRAIADTQARVVDSQRQIEISTNAADAKVRTAHGDAESKTLNAAADANVITTVGDAEAARTRSVGTAEADVIKLKINSMEAGNYAVIETARELARSGKLVPDVVAGGGGDNGGIVNVLLAGLLQDRARKD